MTDENTQSKRKLLILVYIHFKGQITKEDFNTLSNLISVSDKTIYRDVSIMVEDRILIQKTSIYSNLMIYSLNQSTEELIDRFLFAIKEITNQL